MKFKRKSLVRSLLLFSIAMTLGLVMNFDFGNSNYKLSFLEIEALARGEDVNVLCNRYCSGSSRCWVKSQFGNCVFSGMTDDYCYCL